MVIQAGDVLIFDFDTSGKFFEMTKTNPYAPRLATMHNVMALPGAVAFKSKNAIGDMTEAQSELRQRKAEAENIRGQIDYDIRAAFLNLDAAKEQVEVARQNVALATENLARSKDR